MLRAASLALALAAATTPARANTCPFLGGGTIHTEIPLGCPLELYHPDEQAVARGHGSERPWDTTTTSALPHAETIFVERGGQSVELSVRSAMPVSGRSVPVRLDRPGETCEPMIYTENREVDGIALEVEGLQIGDTFSSSRIVDAGPCPRLVLDYSPIEWLQCSAPLEDYEACCATLGPACGSPPPVAEDVGCATGRSTSAWLAIALAIGLARHRRR